MKQRGLRSREAFVVSIYAGLREEELLRNSFWQKGREREKKLQWEGPR